MQPIDPSILPWNRLGLSERDWRDLADAFYALAHGSRTELQALPEHLLEHPIGRLCSRYAETKAPELLEQAGYALTHTRHWYTHLGR